MSEEEIKNNIEELKHLNRIGNVLGTSKHIAIDGILEYVDKLERKLGSKKFREIFKTITCDNGCENLDFEGIERSAITKKNRTKVYYAHPYSAWERGTNENINKLIRRFIPKGADIGEFSHERIKMIEYWINNYPRRIFHGLSSNELIAQISVA